MSQASHGTHRGQQQQDGREGDTKGCVVPGAGAGALLRLQLSDLLHKTEGKAIGITERWDEGRPV